MLRLLRGKNKSKRAATHTNGELLHQENLSAHRPGAHKSVVDMSVVRDQSFINLINHHPATDSSNLTSITTTDLCARARVPHKVPATHLSRAFISAIIQAVLI